MRSRAKKIYIEQPSEQASIEQAIAESITASKKKKPTVTPRRDDFAEYNDFQDLFVYQSNNEITVRMEDYKVNKNFPVITQQLKLLVFLVP